LNGRKETGLSTVTTKRRYESWVIIEDEEEEKNLLDWRKVIRSAGSLWGCLPNSSNHQGNHFRLDSVSDIKIRRWRYLSVGMALEEYGAIS
jgi:hypothetical protein